MYSIKYQVPGPGGDCSASKGPVNPYQAHRVPAATVTTTVAVAYTANIGDTRRPRWSHRSRATTKNHQDPLEDAHQVDPLEADHRAGEDPLDRADPAEALLEDPLGTPTTHQGTATRIPPGGGLSTSAGESSCSSWR